jgi:KDO2-lipid IV(A) lauroyltransferase
LLTAATTQAGVRKLLLALKQGHCVGLLPDQVPPDGQGQWLSFFGRPAYTMTLAARLAQQTGACVLVVWGERLPGGDGFRVHVQPLPGPLAADTVQAATQINQALEGLILSCPGQYLWGYARYKQPRQAA